MIWKPAISPKKNGHRKQGRVSKSWQCDVKSCLQPTRVHRDDNDLANDTTWLTATPERPCEQQTQTTKTTHDPDRHDNDNQTNNTQTNNALDVKPTTSTEAAPKTKTKTKTTTFYSSVPNSSNVDSQQDYSNNKQASEPHLFFQRRYRSASFQVGRGLRRYTWTNCFFITNFSPNREGPRPTHSWSSGQV